VARLAAKIGPRNIHHYDALQRAAVHIETSLRHAGYTPLLHSYEIHGKSFVNISAELPGQEQDDIVVIGAHYDTHKDSPGLASSLVVEFSGGPRSVGLRCG